MAKRKPDKQAKTGRKANGQFAKGASGNPAGRPKSRTLSEELRVRLEEKYPGQTLETYARMIAIALIDKAIEGDVAAIRECFDRTEGKPRQALDVDLTTTDWQELAHANGLNIADVIAEAKQIIESADDGGYAAADSQED
jgi:hypothetical protein